MGLEGYDMLREVEAGSDLSVLDAVAASSNLSKGKGSG